MGRQFAVEMDNRPGEPAHLAPTLVLRGINTRPIAGVGAGQVACAVISTEDEDATREVLLASDLQRVRAMPTEHLVFPL